MLRKISFFIYLGMAASFALAYINEAKIAASLLIAASVAYGLLTPINLYQARFRFRAPYISEVVLGVFAMVLLYGAYEFVGVKFDFYYLFCSCFVIRTLAKNDGALLAD